MFHLILFVSFSILSAPKASPTADTSPVPLPASFLQEYNMIRKCSGVVSKKYVKDKYMCEDFSKDICASYECSTDKKAWVVRFSLQMILVCHCLIA